MLLTILWVLSGISCVAQVIIAYLTKDKHKEPTCTLFGIRCMPDSTPRGVKAHEYTHLVLLTPYCLLLIHSFALPVLWSMGPALWVAWLWSMLLYVAYRIVNEFIADIVGFIADPFHYVQDLEQAYEDIIDNQWAELAILGTDTTVLYPVIQQAQKSILFNMLFFYPPYRLILLKRAMNKINARYVGDWHAYRLR